MMKLRTKYILFIGLLQLVTLVLSYIVFEERKVLFIISEIFILFAILLSVQLYRELLRPLKTLMTGIDALKSMDFNIKFRKTGKFEMDQLIEIYNEMLDQLRIERTKQQQQHYFLEKLVQTSPTGILILDYDYKIEQINPKALSLLNVEEKDIIGYTINEVYHPLLQQISNLKAGESKVISISGMDTYKAEIANFVDRGFSRNFITIEELTAEILAAEKKVYEKVIRMMAHEVNNTIGPVNSILNSTLNTTSIWEKAGNASLYDAIQVATERNNNLNSFMRNLADLVKLPQPVMKNIHIDELVINIIKLWKSKAAEKEIVLKFEKSDSFSFTGDEQQLEQALINIVKNAVESIEERGTISFEINANKRHLKITDTGKGITHDMNDKLFSPFTSTKKDGQGIGLTLVREILMNHHYAFSLKTIKPQQTEFLIQF